MHTCVCLCVCLCVCVCVHIHTYVHIHTAHRASWPTSACAGPGLAMPLVQDTMTVIHNQLTYSCDITKWSHGYLDREEYIYPENTSGMLLITAL